MDDKYHLKINYDEIYDFIKETESLNNSSPSLVLFQNSSSKDLIEFLINGEALIYGYFNNDRKYKVLSVKDGFQLYFKTVLKSLDNLNCLIRKLKCLDKTFIDCSLVLIYNNECSNSSENICIKCFEFSSLCKLGLILQFSVEYLESERIKNSMYMHEIDKNGVSLFSLNMPSELDLFNDQIGGHGLLFDKDFQFLKYQNAIFKPVQKFPKGRTEILFYEELFGFKSSDEYSDLKNFVPNYIGIFKTSSEKVKIFIGLENVLSNCDFSNIADIKLGQITYEPDADPLKITIEKAKYFWREEIGFLFTGIRVYNKEKNEYLFFDRYHGLSLDPEIIFDKGIVLFLSGHSDKYRLAQCFLHKLNALLAWFENQRKFNFYSTSLLLAYDSSEKKLEPMEVTLKLIDFTHTRISSGKDLNSIYGLKSLISYFKRIVVNN